MTARLKYRDALITISKKISTARDYALGAMLAIQSGLLISHYRILPTAAAARAGPAADRLSERAMWTESYVLLVYSDVHKAGGWRRRTEPRLRAVGARFACDRSPFALALSSSACNSFSAWSAMRRLSDLLWRRPRSEATKRAKLRARARRSDPRRPRASSVLLAPPTLVPAQQSQQKTIPYRACEKEPSRNCTARNANAEYEPALARSTNPARPRSACHGSDGLGAL